jgi:hypothetical protein
MTTKQPAYQCQLLGQGKKEIFGRKLEKSQQLFEERERKRSVEFCVPLSKDVFFFFFFLFGAGS